MKREIDIDLLSYRECISTGYADLDNLLCGGFKKGELVLIEQNSTYPETSCLALNIAQNICAAGNGVGFISLVDENSTLLKYMQTFWNNVEKTGECAAFTLEDEVLNLPAIRERIKYLKGVKNAKCVFIDGIECVFDEIEHCSYTDAGDDSYVDAYICADYLQRIARSENITIIASISSFDNSLSPHREIVYQLADIVLDTSLKELPEIRVIVKKCNHNSCTIHSALNEYNIECV